jgi:PA domain
VCLAVQARLVAAPPRGRCAQALRLGVHADVACEGQITDAQMQQQQQQQAVALASAALAGAGTFSVSLPADADLASLRFEVAANIGGSLEKQAFAREWRRLNGVPGPTGQAVEALAEGESVSESGEQNMSGAALGTCPAKRYPLQPAKRAADACTGSGTGDEGSALARPYSHWLLCLLEVQDGELACKRAALLAAAAVPDLAQLASLLPDNCLVLGLYRRGGAVKLSVALGVASGVKHAAAEVQADAKLGAFSPDVLDVASQPPGGQHSSGASGDGAAHLLAEPVLPQWLADAGVIMRASSDEATSSAGDDDRLAGTACAGVRKAMARWGLHRVTGPERGLNASSDAAAPGGARQWLPLRVAEPFDACAPLVAPAGHHAAEEAASGAAQGAYAGAAVLVGRGTCSFVSKAETAAAAGAAVVLVVNTKSCSNGAGTAGCATATQGGQQDSGGLFEISGDEGASVAVPTALVRGEFGRALVATVRCAAGMGKHADDLLKCDHAQRDSGDTGASDEGDAWLRPPRCGAPVCAALHATAADIAGAGAQQEQTARLLVDTLLRDKWVPHLNSLVRLSRTSSWLCVLPALCISFAPC